MKAIITKYLGFTETKPSRIKASAEGVTHRIYSNSALEKIQLESEPSHNLHEIAARLFASERGWKNAIVSGGTPKPDVWCHCLVPRDVVAGPVSVNEELAGALEGIFKQCAITHKHWGEGCNRKEADEAVAAGHKALERAGSFLHGQELVVVQARTLLAQGVTQHVDGKASLSGYHVTLLATALELLDGPPAPKPTPEPWKVLAVSSNHESFGHKGVIVGRPNGEALELHVQAYSGTPLPNVGDLLDTLPTSEVQPRKLPQLPWEIRDREFTPATAADFLAICGKFSVEVSVARESEAIREAVDGGNASPADLERLFQREF